MMKGMEHFSFKEPLKVVAVQPGVQMAWMDLINGYKYLVGGNAEEGTRPLSAVSSERRRDQIKHP